MKYCFTLFIFCTMSQMVCAQFRYINPIPGSLYHNPETNIILKNGSFIDRSTVTDKNLVEIYGSTSGSHSWIARLSDDNKSVIIKPYPVFACGETVSVTVHPVLKNDAGEKIEGTSFTFQIRDKITPEMRALYNEIRLQTFIDDFGYDPRKKINEKITYPLDSMPTYTINVNNNPAPGRIFYCNHEDQITEMFGTNSFPTIIENDGTIVWARDMGANGLDFKLNQNGYLTFFSDTQWMVMDSNYNIIDSVQCKNGYELETQGHDMVMYLDGHAFLMAYDIQTIDMTPYGGVPDAKVQGLIIQELDSNRDVVFEWSSWDHFLFTDADVYTSLTNSLVDYVHGNSLERDYDGNVIISSRNMDELTKIDHETGNIIWRMGGENNQFTFINDNIPEHFSSQHDLRRIPNGHITIYNNGNHLNPLISSAKEYALDEVNKVATLVWHYEHPDVGPNHVYGAATGNVQRLPNGNTMIDWGLILGNAGIPNQTEVDPNKNIVWEMTFDSSNQKSYRVHKYEWNPCSRLTGYTMKATLKPGKVILTWGAATGAKSYKVQYRPLGSNTWTTVSAKTPKLQLTALSQGTYYEWHVQTLCSISPPIKSTYSVLDTFKTPPLKILEPENITPELISLYPVPVSDQITIEINENTNGSLIILNSIGVVMYERKSQTEENGALQINVQQWPAGVYLVQFSDGTSTEVKKFIKE